MTNPARGASPSEGAPEAPIDPRDEGTGLTGGAEVTGPGADAGVTSGSRATATGANLAETQTTDINPDDGSESRP